MNGNIEKRISSMQYDLLHYPEESSADKLKRGIKKYVLHRNVQKPDRFFWPHAMMAQTLAEYYDKNKDTALVETLQQYFDGWIARKEKMHYVDNVMNGYTLLSLCEKTEKAEYKDTLEHMAEYLLTAAKAQDGSLLYRAGQKDIVYADTIGMACPFLFRYGIMTQNKKLTELCMTQFHNFWKSGMDAASGLPYHGYHAKTGEKLGIIGWGRAAGWIFLGLSESLKYAEDTQKEDILKLLRELLEKVLIYQRKDGMFSWQLQALEGPADISATGMILGALQLAVNLKAVDGRYTENINRGRNAITEKKDAFQCCLAECEGLGCYPQRYGMYPWGTAAGTLFLIRSGE